jgi:hypothetical protein
MIAYASSVHTSFYTFTVTGQLVMKREYAASDIDAALSPIFRRSGRIFRTLIGGIPGKSPSVSEDRSPVDSTPS